MKDVTKNSGAYATYLAVRFVAMVIGMMPMSVSLRVMRMLGSMWFHLPHILPESRVPGILARRPRFGWVVRLSNTSNRLLLRFREHRFRAENNIRRSFPDMTEEQVSAIARGSMQQLAMLVVELLMTPRIMKIWTWRRYMRMRGLEEALRILIGGKGCIMLTGHLGNWELLGYALAVLGFDIVAIMRPLDNQYLNHYLLDRREQSGLKLLYKKGATGSAPEVLKAGGSLCFIADQNAGRKGTFVEFFGRKASTYKSIGLLAMECRVPIIVGCARRLGRDFFYEMHVNRIIRPEEWEDKDDPLLWITAQYTKAIEDLVRLAPEQYLWMHRRWKTRPKEELKRAEVAG